MVLASPPRPLTAISLRLAPTPIVAGPADDLVTHVRATLDRQLRALLAHQRDAGNAEEPEAVHQMRVAGRRIRVALRIGRPALGVAGERLRDEVAWLGGILGPVRDLDVLCERLTTRARELPEVDQPGFAEVMSALDTVRAAGRERVVAALAGRRYRTLLRSLAALAYPAQDAPEPEEGISNDPVDLVRPPMRRLRKEVRLAGQHPPADELHALRIRGKRVRYAAEFGSELAGGKARKRLREVAGAARRFQDVLGEHQDTVAAEDLLRQLADAARTPLEVPLSPDALLVLGRLVEREHAQRGEHRANWRAAWRTLNRAAKPVLG